MNDEQEHFCAGLIHQTIPDMEGTEPRPNSENIKSARKAVREAIDDYIDGGFSACIIEHNIDNLIAAVKADTASTELPAWFTRGALDELAAEYDLTHRLAIVESLKHEILKSAMTDEQEHAQMKERIAQYDRYTLLLMRLPRLHLMQCLDCRVFGTPLRSDETVCGNCNSTNTRMWFHDQKIGSATDSSEQASDERTGAQRP